LEIVDPEEMEPGDHAVMVAAIGSPKALEERTSVLKRFMPMR